MSTPNVSPLTETEITFFSGQKSVAIFSEKGKRFVGGVAKLDYDIDPKGKIGSLRVVFKWLVEVEGEFLTPVRHGFICKENWREVREFIKPHKIEVAKPREGVITCCAGTNHDQKIKLSSIVLHVQAVNEIGVECGVINPPQPI